MMALGRLVREELLDSKMKPVYCGQEWAGVGLGEQSSQRRGLVDVVPRMPENRELESANYY